MMKPSRLRLWLRRRADAHYENLALTGAGFAVFFVGLLLIGSAEFLITPSLTAELTALFGLILLGLGCILAAVGFLSLSILRIFRFLDQDDDNKPPSRH
ncbi:hypothetical protein [Nitrincola alkalilacustris]|uniref:hypothetical protein n=1 Tax=Nitrincola alkalilacustris TaxID=1571224 RepID=UPI00124E2911|nr:hypothetical protein [Nitrincola alkalilacustris]